MHIVTMCVMVSSVTGSSSGSITIYAATFVIVDSAVRGYHIYKDI